MRLKTKLVLAITGMIVALVVLFSYIYISQLLHQRIIAAYDTATLLSRELQDAATDAQPDFSDTRVDTSNPDAVRAALIETLQTDPNLNTFLDSIVANSPIIYDAAIAGQDNQAILDTDPNLIGKPLSDRPDLAQVRDASFRRQIRLVFSAPRVYEVRMPLQLNGAAFGSTRVGVSTVFLKNEIQPHLHRVTAGDTEALHEDEQRQDEYGLVTLKIAHLGRQMRDVKEVFSALKDNLDQIMATLQDGLMLFTRDSRVVLVSASAERFVGRPRSEILGRNLNDVFAESTRLGHVVLESFRSRRPLNQGEVEGENGRRVQVSV